MRDKAVPEGYLRQGKRLLGGLSLIAAAVHIGAEVQLLQPVPFLFPAHQGERMVDLSKLQGLASLVQSSPLRGEERHLLLPLRPSPAQVLKVPLRLCEPFPPGGGRSAPQPFPSPLRQFPQDGGQLTPQVLRFLCRNGPARGLAPGQPLFFFHFFRPELFVGQGLCIGVKSVLEQGVQHRGAGLGFRPQEGGEGVPPQQGRTQKRLEGESRDLLDGPGRVQLLRSLL